MPTPWRGGRRCRSEGGQAARPVLLRSASSSSTRRPRVRSAVLVAKLTGSPTGSGPHGGRLLGDQSTGTPCRDRRISSGAVNPRWRIWLTARSCCHGPSVWPPSTPVWPRRCRPWSWPLPVHADPARRGPLRWRRRCQSCPSGGAPDGWAVHLEHLHPTPTQTPGQAGPRPPGPFHPDPGHRAEARHPLQQLLVTLHRRGERLDPQQAADAAPTPRPRSRPGECPHHQ